MARAPRILVHFYGTENAWHTICFFYLYEGTLQSDWRINIAPLFSLARSINKTDSDLRVRILSLHAVYLFAFLAGRQWWRRGRYRGGLGQAAQFVWYAGSTPQGRIPHDERSVLWKKKKRTSLFSLVLRLFRDPVTLLKCSLIVERNSHWTEWLNIHYLFLSTEAANLNAKRSWTANIKREKAIIRPRGTDKNGFLYFPIAYLIFWTPELKRSDVSLTLAKKRWLLRDDTTKTFTLTLITIEATGHRDQ